MNKDEILNAWAELEPKEKAKHNGYNGFVEYFKLKDKMENANR